MKLLPCFLIALTIASVSTQFGSTQPPILYYLDNESGQYHISYIKSANISQEIKNIVNSTPVDSGCPRNVLGMSRATKTTFNNSYQNFRPYSNVYQYAVIYRTTTKTNCTQTYTYYINWGNGTIMNDGCQSKTYPITNPICLSNYRYPPNIRQIDPSLNQTNGTYSQEPAVSDAIANIYRIFYYNQKVFYDLDNYRQFRSFDRFLRRYRRVIVFFSNIINQTDLFLPIPAVSTMFYDMAQGIIPYFAFDHLDPSTGSSNQLNNDEESTESQDNSNQDSQIASSQNSQTKLQLQIVLHFIKFKKPQLIDSSLQQYSIKKLEDGVQYNLFLVKHEGKNVIQFTVTVNKKNLDNQMVVQVYEEHKIAIDEDVEQKQIVQSGSPSSQNSNLRSSN